METLYEILLCFLWFFGAILISFTIVAGIFLGALALEVFLFKYFFFRLNPFLKQAERYEIRRAV